MLICATCAVERDEPTPDVCPICADERQYVPEDGQQWLTLDELAGAGRKIVLEQNEPGLIAVSTEPKTGIGQTAQLVVTPKGSLLWDPVGYVDDNAVAAVLEHGPVAAIAASHPHMFGVQVEWSRRLGNAPVLIAAADREWLGRSNPSVTFWSGSTTIADGLVLHQTGGHFPGSAVAHWAAGAGGKGVLLTGDTVFPNPDRRTVAFMRSYPNRLPLSGGVALRIAAQLEMLTFDRIYGNFNNVIDSGAKGVLHDSAQRHAAWTRGDFDHLT
ncbi:hydrolase [Paenarthrobacter nitroguajacolicus]|uniref:MBL fold metallo-hydrolase n=1 Tax=Paenarthrobacter nitroguajacolicus TaxID=211146 RepID=UPI0015B960E9|nr:MBL fold metallo-hydrolase [Paenarthrobacter nitroguajacolicus]NWL11090.1 hydrolase [Paenarthrobacter nitroguajacolicus]